MGSRIKTAGMIGRGRAALSRLSGILLLHVLITSAAAHGAPLPSENSSCLNCHGVRTLALRLKSGEERSLYVDAERFAQSIHGKKLLCTNCHRDIKTYPHPKRTFENLRVFTLAYYENCKGCHFDNYTRSLDSVHYTVFSKGDARAPLCVDCHGAHDVAGPRDPKSRISKTCARCHEEVYTRYAGSVHGKALLHEGNVDVPVCTDCHRSHNIEDPRTASFHLRSPSLCAACHTDEALMKKYGISTHVLRSYLKDFHGKTASFSEKTRSKRSDFTVVCTDCHGVHDIVPVVDPPLTAIKTNLVRTCRKCHDSGVESVPAAWLSHYDPTPEKAPLIYAVEAFYGIFIPILVTGFVAQILLHVWRIIVNR